MGQMPKIGLALSSGAARGLAHLGVLRALKKYNVPIDFIAGSSMGALIGCLYACGLDADFMIKFSNQLRTKSWLDLCMPRSGLVSGKKVEAMLKILTRDREFADLDLPFAAVATDIERGEAVVLRSGKLAPAVRASISIPVVFKPVSLEGRLLVDGGVVDRVPISVVREMGADLVIAVDVNKFVTCQPVKNVFDVMFQTLDIMEKNAASPDLLDVDILIRPKVGHISRGHFQRVDELAEQGELAAEAVMSKLMYILRERWGKECKNPFRG